MGHTWFQTQTWQLAWDLETALISGAMQAGTLRAGLACLGYITAAVNPTEWAPALRPFTLLLQYSTDARPKVRKRAQYGLVDVLAALQGTPALQGASDAVFRGTAMTCNYV